MRGPKGITNIKLIDFKEEHEWKLTAMPYDKTSIKIYLTNEQFYHLGMFCINNGLTRNKFCGEAILDAMIKYKPDKKHRIHENQSIMEFK